MRKLPGIALALAAAMIGGTSLAAAPESTQTHLMTVPLPDGAVARVEYVGDVAPRVTVAPAGVGHARAPTAAPTAMPMPMPMPMPMALPSFADFDRMIADMNRRSQAMIQQARQAARRSSGVAPYAAAFGNAPAGQTSTTVVSVSQGGKTCTRTTEVVSQGPSKAPKVTSRAVGDCGASAAVPVNRT